MTAPKPVNFDALSDAWNDPTKPHPAGPPADTGKPSEAL